MAEPNAESYNNSAGGDFAPMVIKNGINENAEARLEFGDCENQLAPRQPAQPAAGDGPLVEKDANANTKKIEANNNELDDSVSRSQEEILIKTTSERDELRKKLAETERKLSSLQTTSSPTTVDETSLRRELEVLKNALTQTKLSLDERERRVANQDNQIAALIKQVSSLKEVVTITKDMLSIRNMEVKHLQEDIDKMETRITNERKRHDEMIGKMDAAVKLNADLKKEYQTQLQLFQDLRGKYEEKVTLLSEENRALETAVRAQPAL